MLRFENLDKELKGFNQICNRLKNSDNLACFDNQELHVLFEAQRLAEDLGLLVFELSKIMYAHKILL